MKMLEMLVGMVLSCAGWFCLFMIYFADSNQYVYVILSLILISLGSWFILEED